MRVLGLAGLVCTHEVGQALDVVDAHHVDVVVEAESLDEGKVDLEGDVTLVLLVGGEDAERHAVWVTGDESKADQKVYSSTLRVLKRQKKEIEHFHELQYLHIHDFSRFVNSNCQVVLLLGSDQQLLQGCACTLHP